MANRINKLNIMYLNQNFKVPGAALLLENLLNEARVRWCVSEREGNSDVACDTDMTHNMDDGNTRVRYDVHYM